MIWLILSLIFVPLIWLLLAGGREDESEADPVTHYRRQLDELVQDEESGFLKKEAAAAARLEIERRILKLADHRTGNQHGTRSGRHKVLALCFLLIAISFGLYHFVGRPDVISQPGQAVNLLAAPVNEDGMTMGEAIAQIEAHLAKNPEDKQGWEVLAKSARSARAFSKSARAFAALVRLDPTNSKWQVQQLDAYLLMAQGQFTPAANLLLQSLTTSDPSHPAVQYYMGIARLQAGDAAAAKAIWLRLADNSAKDAPWMASVWAQLGELGEKPPALTKEQVNQVADMSDIERNAFIQSMIARLEARLESAPNDPAGWMMLARSRAALGEKDAAVATLIRAIDLIDPDKRAELQAFLDNLTKTPNS